MKKIAYFALLSAAFLTPTVAFAAQPGNAKTSGHYEYRWIRHYPRAPFLGAKRIWVADKIGSDSSNCIDMKMKKDSLQAAACREEMRKFSSPSKLPAA